MNSNQSSWLRFKPSGPLLSINMRSNKRNYLSFHLLTNIYKDCTISFWISRCSSSISRWLWISAKVFKWSEWIKTIFTLSQCSGSSGIAWIIFRTYSPSEISFPVALRSEIMTLMVCGCSAMVQLASILYCIHFKNKVQILVSDVCLK